MTERVRVREITNEEGNRLLKIVRRSSGSVVTWRRAQIVCGRPKAWTCSRSPRSRSRARTGSVPFCPHLSTKKDPRVGEWAEANNVEFAYVPTNASWLNRIEAQFQALLYFALDGTDHQSHEEQNNMIRRYIAWRNRHAKDKALQELTR